MIVNIVEIDYFYLGLVNSKRYAPVFGDKKAPNAPLISYKLMRFPSRHRPQLRFLFHVLQERDDISYLFNELRLQTAGVAVLDETPQSLVSDTAYVHLQVSTPTNNICKS
jgi:hypothetical protein